CPPNLNHGCGLGMPSSIIQKLPQLKSSSQADVSHRDEAPLHADNILRYTAWHCPKTGSASMRKAMTSVLMAAGLATVNTSLPQPADAQPIVVTPIPAQVPAKEDLAAIPDTR